MMREQYWGLFWTTGMPEAWLMSRERMGQLENAAGPGTEGTAAVAQPGTSDNSPRGIT